MRAGKFFTALSGAMAAEAGLVPFDTCEVRGTDIDGNEIVERVRVPKSGHGEAVTEQRFAGDVRASRLG